MSKCRTCTISAILVLLIAAAPAFATSTLCCGSDTYGVLTAVSSTGDSVASLIVTRDREQVLQLLGSNLQHAVVTWEEHEVWLVYAGDEDGSMRFELFVDRNGGVIRFESDKEAAGCDWMR